MTRALPRTNFNSSRLIRFLADLAVVDIPETGQDFAEKLALWLDFTDAITLSAVHNVSLPDTSFAGISGADASLLDEFALARAGLVNRITQSCLPNDGGGSATRLKLPAPPPDASIDPQREIAVAYEPYRRFYLAHQREMELNIGPLRDRVRKVLTRTSAPLGKLAALDEALGKTLSDRESRLLASVPMLLEKRFGQLREAHRQALLANGQADEPARWMQPRGWLAIFCGELQSILLAELDLRLQPATGLIDAYSKQVGKTK